MAKLREAIDKADFSTPAWWRHFDRAYFELSESLKVSPKPFRLEPDPPLPPMVFKFLVQVKIPRDPTIPLMQQGETALAGILREWLFQKARELNSADPCGVFPSGYEISVSQEP